MTLLFRIASIQQYLFWFSPKGKSSTNPRIATLFSPKALFTNFINLVSSTIFPFLKSSTIYHSNAPKESTNSMGFPSGSYSGVSSNSFILIIIFSISLDNSMCSISAFYSNNLQKVVRPILGFPITNICTGLVRA